MSRVRQRLGSACLLLVCATASAQTLSHRKPSAGTPIMPTDTRSAPSALPADAEGEYRWGESGEVIQLYQESGRLRGYLTRRSERREAASTPITVAFTTATADDGGLTFATRSIHGDSYSFRGRLVRGGAPSPRQDGYYLLVGTLTIHLGGDSPDNRLVGEPTVPAPGGGDLITRQVRLPRTADSHPAR